MKNAWKIAVVAVLIAAVGVVFALKQAQRQTGTNGGGESGSTLQAADPAADSVGPKTLPRLVELGSDVCRPCKRMQVVLAGLKRDFAGQLSVEFIDVVKDPDAGEPYKASLIPTQVFFDTSGEEFDRHQGFIGREDILAKFARRGIVLVPETTE